MNSIHNLMSKKQPYFKFRSLTAMIVASERKLASIGFKAVVVLEAVRMTEEKVPYAPQPLSCGSNLVLFREE